MPVTYTPIRYPGGKSKIYPLVNSIISGSGLDGCAYEDIVITAEAEHTVEHVGTVAWFQPAEELE